LPPFLRSLKQWPIVLGPVVRIALTASKQER